MSSVSKALLFAKVLTPDLSNAVKVSVSKYVMDERLTMYFKETSHLYAAEDPLNQCQEGDHVIIRQFPGSENEKITHKIEQVVYKRGNYIDPVTGKRCAGTEYIDDIKKECDLFGSQRPYFQSRDTK